MAHITSRERAALRCPACGSEDVGCCRRRKRFDVTRYRAQEAPRDRFRHYRPIGKQSISFVGADASRRMRQPADRRLMAAQDRYDKRAELSEWLIGR